MSVVNTVLKSIFLYYFHLQNLSRVKLPINEENVIKMMWAKNCHADDESSF